jgi:pyruvate formate lyase activating enzyme
MGNYFRISGNRIECQVCPHFCKIAEGRTGICGVRKNNGKEIELITYGVISGYSSDPVEKKPLYHYFPGYNILSVGSYGCNMRCDFCQNYNISQNVPKELNRQMSAEQLTAAALCEQKNIGMAFTYNEPTISFEFIRDVAISVKNAGMHTVLVSNGYVNKDPLDEIIGFTDAFNIDLKAFNETSHKKLTGAELEPVKQSLKQISKSGRHLEITSLIVPGHNDDEKDMTLQADWIASELGKDVPLHLSRYFPMFRRSDPATSVETLQRLFEIASEKLDYVYMGNTHSDEGQDTKCPGCGKIVTYRKGYNTRIIDIDGDGKCEKCGTLIYRNFTFSLLKES